jgi:hypothetical protein
MTVTKLKPNKLREALMKELVVAQKARPMPLLKK